MYLLILSALSWSGVFQQESYIQQICWFWVLWCYAQVVDSHSSIPKAGQRRRKIVSLTSHNDNTYRYIGPVCTSICSWSKLLTAGTTISQTIPQTAGIHRLFVVRHVGGRIKRSSLLHRGNLNCRRNYLRLSSHQYEALHGAEGREKLGAGFVNIWVDIDRKQSKCSSHRMCTGINQSLCSRVSWAQHAGKR